jgi:hypothetical protein
VRPEAIGKQPVMTAGADASCAGVIVAPIPSPRGRFTVPGADVTVITAGARHGAVQLFVDRGIGREPDRRGAGGGGQRRAPSIMAAVNTFTPILTMKHIDSYPNWQACPESSTAGSHHRPLPQNR